jgi:2-oxoisovalerate dehydrogenase E1 component
LGKQIVSREGADDGCDQVEMLPLMREIYDFCVKAREIDALELDFVRRGEAFFHVSCSGHENLAFLGPHLIADDYLHCHYRDKALMLYRGVTPKQFFLSLFCKDESHSHGRQMSAHISDRTLNILSIVGPVGNNALQSVGIASKIKDSPTNPIVYCAIGDGTSQQGEVLEGVAQAVRCELPVLFVVENNGLAISSHTKGRTFFSRPDGKAEEFYGLPINYINGCNPLEVYKKFGAIVQQMRRDRKPAIVVIEVERLTNHTNVDDQEVYRTSDEIAHNWETSDPIVILEKWLLDNGVSQVELSENREKIRSALKEEAENARSAKEPQPEFTAKAPLSEKLLNCKDYCGGSPAKGGEGESLTMIEAIREVLRYHLKNDPAVTLYGEDIEDPKGDVFGVTRGLTEEFAGRVRNSPLCESTIVGFSVGEALAGGRPVAFLQFADFIPIAFNQISTEMASMYWRTGGKWQAPVILMVSMGGFKPGLGPFHAASMESTVAHIPGLDVFLPSTAGDAAALLNAAFESKRPTVFFYPKSLLNSRSYTTTPDIEKQIAKIGTAVLRAEGSDLTFVGWGNVLPILEKVAATLAKYDVTSDVIDLRSISPWDESLVLESARKTARVVIVSEENGTASMAAEIAATIAEKVEDKVQIKRVTRPDTFIPCNFANQLEVLPSYKSTLEAALELLGGTVEWECVDKEGGDYIINALGASPSDESVTIVEWFVKAGDVIGPGAVLADAEAEKASFSVSSPVAGMVQALLVAEGESTHVGSPLLKVSTENVNKTYRPITKEDAGLARITLPEKSLKKSSKQEDRAAQKQEVLSTTAGDDFIAGIVAVSAVTGSRKVTNEEISTNCPTWTAADIFRRTGIKNRYWVNDDEDALTLALQAAKDVLKKGAITLEDLDMLIVSTGSPIEITPSMACSVLSGLSDPARSAAIPTYDINAACSGYLYGLLIAYDFLRSVPTGRVLLITTEVSSDIVDPADPDTAAIFGDGATATLLVGAEMRSQAKLKVERPVLGAKGDLARVLQIPRDLTHRMYMDGVKVFPEAVRNMVLFLNKACAAAGVKISDLDRVISHQANQRILNSISQKAHLAEGVMYSMIAEYGNTSSSSIPFCIDKLWDDIQPAKTWGLCAFGGGFTFGGAVLKTL